MIEVAALWSGGCWNSYCRMSL